MDGCLPPDEVDGSLRDFLQPHPAEFAARFQERFDALAAEVVRLNREALEHGHHVLVFPEGTRSRRLSRGRTGLVQMALHLEAPIVPVGCSGSDRLYPDRLPFSRGGRVIYRLGRPFWPRDFGLEEAFVPLTAGASRRLGERFQEFTDRMMDRIDALLDPEYRSSGEPSGQEEGAERFL